MGKLNSSEDGSDHDSPPGPGTGITASIRRVYNRFLRIRGNPREIALGFALGLFIGMTPFFGLHTVTAVFLAVLFGWNKIAAAIGVFITNPVSAPFIYGITYKVGELFYSGKGTGLSFENLSLQTLFNIIRHTPEILIKLCIGGVVLGVPISVFGYFFAVNAIHRYRRDIQHKLAAQREKLLKRKPAGKPPKKRPPSS